MDTELEHRLTSVEDRSKSNTKRIDEMERRQNDQEKLISTVAVLAEREENVEKNVEEIKADVKSLTSKPGKRWDNLVSEIIKLAIAAVVGFIFAKIGL